jgi:tyrosine-protein kinase Etk/Wzc
MDEPLNNTCSNDGEIHLLDYLIIIAKYSRKIIFITAMVTVMVYLILLIKPNEYTATARLMPIQQNLTLSAQLLDNIGTNVLPGGAGVGLGGSIATGMVGLKSRDDMYVAMMTSETVFDAIIGRFHLMKLYKTKYHEDARKSLSKNVQITAGKKDGIIVIEVTCTSPKLAAEMANAFIEELDRLLQGLAVQEAKGRLAFLEKERLQVSHNLIKAEESVRLFSEKNSVLQIDTQTRGAIEYIAKLRAEIDSKEVGLQVLRQQATPFNYDVVRMEMEIKGLKEKLRAADSQLENCVADVCLPTSKTPALAMEYLRLFREAKFQESLYQLYTKLAEIARLDMVRDVAVVKVLAPGLPPEKNSNKRLFPVILVGIITFLAMIIVAFGLEQIQNMKKREDDVQRLSVLKDYLRPWMEMLVVIKNRIIRKRNL